MVRCSWNPPRSLGHQEAESVGIPLHATFGQRDPRSGPQNPDWKSDHKLLWEKFPDLLPGNWPLDVELWEQAECIAHPRYADVRFHGLFPRECEAAVLLHCIFVAKSEHEFLDINQNIVRHVDSCIDADTNSIKGSPWKSYPPTLVGSGKMMVRWTPPDKRSLTVVRVMEAIELARLIGWPDSMWTSRSPTSPLAQENLETISNMCGNAFSLFQFGPWQMATLATYGRFHHAFNQDDQAAPLSDDNGGDSSSPGSDSD